MKRSTRRQLRDSGMYGLLALVIIGVAVLADWSAIKQNFLDGAVFKELWPRLITEAARNTILYTAISFAGGLAFAIVLALMKLTPLRLYRWIASVYIEFFRGLPALVVIFGFAYAVPLAFQWHPPGGSVGAGCLGLIVVSAAYMAETLRAGIQAVPKGQVEAARSLGMSGLHTMVSVTLPQAFRIVMPPLTNEFVLLLKDTSLLQFAGVGIGQGELTNFGEQNLQSSGNATPLFAIAIVYLIITLPLTQVVARLERRAQKAR